MWSGSLGSNGASSQFPVILFFIFHLNLSNPEELAVCKITLELPDSSIQTPRGSSSRSGMIWGTVTNPEKKLPEVAGPF